MNQSKYDEAIQAFDEAIRLNPTNAMAWVSKGVTLHHQGKSDEAVKAFDEAIRRDPNLAETLSNYCAVAWPDKGVAFINQSKYYEAIRDSDEIIMLNPNNALAWYKKGAALEALGQTAEADAAFAKSRELGFES